MKDKRIYGVNRDTTKPQYLRYPIIPPPPRNPRISLPLWQYALLFVLVATITWATLNLITLP